MGRITRRAAEELRRTVQVVKGLPPGGAGFVDPGRPIRLAKTLASHPAGQSKRVQIWWGPKGSEQASPADGDTLFAYNRFTDFEANEFVHIVRIDDGWEIISRACLANTGCEACNTVPGDSLVITVTGSVEAAEEYVMVPRCGAGEWTFTWDSSLTWIGSASIMELDCGEESARSLTGTMVVSGVAPGDVVITISDGSGAVAVFENLSAWQPCAQTRMRLVSYDPTCPCGGWDNWPCLTAVEVVP